MTISNQFTIPTILAIAGFDGSGGAGLQADNKTFAALGCYGLNVLSALSIQNTLGVKSILDLPMESFKMQLDSIFEDSYPHCIKIGMLHSKEQFNVLISYLKAYDGFVVYDPVLVSSSGYQFINQQDLIPHIYDLMPLINLITPNLDELSFILSTRIKTLDDVKAAIPNISKWACEAILVKGGHLNSTQLTDILVEKNQQIQYYQHEKIESMNTHGTGCTLSSAIASYIAKGCSLTVAVEKAIQYVQEALKRAKDVKLGQGKGGLIQHIDLVENPFL